MKILFITFETVDTPCPRYRAFWPAKGLTSAGHYTRVCLLKNCGKEDIKWADIVIFERIVNALVYEMRDYERIKLAQKIISLWNYSSLRKMTGYDLDDYIFFSDDQFNFYNVCTWIQEILLRKSNFITTSSRFLVDKLKTYNKVIFQLNNGIDLDHIHPVELPREKEVTTIGWVCGHTHYRDEPIVMDMIEPLTKKFERCIQFLFIGKISSKMRKWIVPYSSYVKRENYCHWNMLPHLQKEVDINLIPLVDCNLNRGKSAIHYLESGALKVPSVCSRVGEFQYIIKDGENGFLASSTKEWLEKLEMLIENPGLRKEMGERAYQDVINNHTIEVQSKTYDRYLHSIHLPSLGGRLKKLISANIYFAFRRFKEIVLYLIDKCRESLIVSESVVLQVIKKQTKKVFLYLAERRKFCSLSVAIERSCKADGPEEEVFKRLDEINKGLAEFHGSQRVIFTIDVLSLFKRVEPIITLSNAFIGRGYSVVIVAPKAIRERIKMYMNPHVVMQDRVPKKLTHDVTFTLAECCKIIRDNSLIVVDPYIFCPLTMYKKSNVNFESVLGCLGGTEGTLLNLYNFLKEHYENIQFIFFQPSQSGSRSLPKRCFREVSYQCPESLVRFYSSIDVFIYLDCRKELSQIPLEAMACGTPVISTALNERYLKDNNAILFSDDGQSRSLCEKVLDILDNRNYRENLIRDGLKCAQRFNPSPLIEHFERIILET